MKIVKILGGLGNQMFQYALYISLKHKCNGETVKIDTSCFRGYPLHNGYELERVFGIKANLLSKYFTPDAWEKLIDNKRKGISI